MREATPLLTRPLPPSMFLHHGNFLFRTTVDGSQKWINFGRDLPVALAKHRQYVERHKSHNYVLKALYGSDAQLVGGIPLSYLKQMLLVVKKRARSRGWDFELTEDIMLALAKRSKGRCELSGIPFEIGAKGRSKRIWAPSVDRIKCTDGYVPDNVRFVCVAVNIALQDFGDEALIRIAKGILKTVNTQKIEQRKQALRNE